LEDGSAHGVVDDVDAPALRCGPDGVDNVVAAVVDGHVGAQLAATRHLLGSSGGGDDARAGRRPQLHGGRPHAPGSGVHQQRLARPQAGAAVQGEVAGHEGDVGGGGGDVVDGGGNGIHAVGDHDALLGQ